MVVACVCVCVFNYFAGELVKTHVGFKKGTFLFGIVCSLKWAQNFFFLTT